MHFFVSLACSQAVIASCIGCIISAKKVILLMSHTKAVWAYSAAPMKDLQVVTFVGVSPKAKCSEAIPSSFKDIPSEVTAKPANSPTEAGVLGVLGLTGYPRTSSAASSISPRSTASCTDLPRQRWSSTHFVHHFFHHCLNIAL